MRLKGSNSGLTLFALACLLWSGVSCDDAGATSTGNRTDVANLQPDGSSEDDVSSGAKPPPAGDGGSGAGDATGATDGANPAEDGSRDNQSEGGNSGGNDASSGDDSAGDDSDVISDGGPGQDAADAAPIDIEVEGGPAGQPCATHVDCASGLCVSSVCVDATSCLTLLQSSPGLPDREYEIDPDGPGKGVAPFVAYCDMTTDGGGWTTLPLRFNDSSYWSITQGGDPCVTIDTQDNDGNFRQYQSVSDLSFGNTYMEFVPPIAATSVRFVNFNYTNGGQNNTMDFEIGELPSQTTPPNTSYEGWYFADPSAPATPVGYTFATNASCTPPYDVEHDVTCSRDVLTDKGAGPTAPFLFSETIPLSGTVTNFDMILMQGCPSYPLLPLVTGEQFHIETPPAADGVWITGIAVR